MLEVPQTLKVSEKIKIPTRPTTCLSMVIIV